MATRLLLALPLLGLALTLGCDDPEAMRSLDLAELPERFACRDVTVVAATPDGNEALLLGIEDGLAAAARESGEPIDAHYDLPDPRLTVRWVAGSNVYQGQCGRDSGALWGLDEQHDAVTGHIAVRVTPEPDGSLTLSATLDDLVLESADRYESDSFELEPTQLVALIVDP